MTYSALMRKTLAPRSFVSFLRFHHSPTSQHCIGVSERETVKAGFALFFPADWYRTEAEARASVYYIEKLRAGSFYLALSGSCHGAVCRPNELAADHLAPQPDGWAAWLVGRDSGMQIVSSADRDDSFETGRLDADCGCFL